MGLTWSSGTAGTAQEIAPGQLTESETDPSSAETVSEPANSEETEEERKKRREEELTKFKEDLAVKRDIRKKRLGEVADELKGLREQLHHEVTRRQELEVQLKKAMNGLVEETADKSESRLENVDGDKLSKEVEVMRISRYDEDEDDEIDILDEDDEEKVLQGDKVRDKNKRKAKKRVSFSLELLKEENEQENAGETGQDETVSDSENLGQVQTEDASEADETAELKAENKKLENQIKALKDVANLSKQLIALRESQVDELNNKLTSLSEKEKDFEKKISAMKELRRLYDEKGRAMAMEHRQLLEAEKTRVAILESRLRIAEDLNEDLCDKTKHLQEKVKNLDNQLDDVKGQLSETKIKLATEKEGFYHASSQISLINNLVSQIIAGPELDLDHLARFLEDNHALINELTAKGDIDYVASALVGVAGGIVEMPKEEKSDIAENLGKVWRVLVELLSHHKKTDNGGNQEWESCYKSVDTPKGPKLVISVSQTFIKLKDLILEKNSLVKEVGRLKKLNEHLEKTMDDQQGRLTLVTEELHNTWDVVNKLKRQHDNLHTHETILKHELKHKRSMLNGLKKQLGICKEQWDLAREKNSKTENDWMLLRAEFAQRKQKKKISNSAESGFGDEDQSPEYDTDDDKSIEIEEESPDNSVADRNQRGSGSPSELSVSESILDECNGPISEILDGIVEEAYKIAKETSKSDIIIMPKIYTEESREIQATDGLETETLQPVSLSLILEGDQIDYDYYTPICDTVIKRLEQIPEVEEEASIDNISNYGDNSECSDIIQNDDKPQELSAVDLTSDAFRPDGHKTDKSDETAAAKTETGNLTTDEILKRRDERLRRMEESCKSLFVKMGQTSNRGNEISNKLDQIHATYGPQATTDNDETSSTPQHQNITNNEN